MVASEHRLAAEFGSSGAFPRGSARQAGTQAGTFDAGGQDGVQSAAEAVKAWKHLLCKHVEQTVARRVFSSVETPSSVVKGVPRSVSVRGARQTARRQEGCDSPSQGSVCQVFGAGWHLQPSGRWLVRGLAAPTAAPPSPLLLFPAPHPGSLSNSTAGVVSISINQLYPDNLRRFKHQYPK